MRKVEVYTKDYCPYCRRAKAFLQQQDIEFIEYKIDEQPELRPEMIQRSNGGTTVPQILIDTQPIGGCDDMMALVENNKLDELLAD
jgi:glutaredoxin 3